MRRNDVSRMNTDLSSAIRVYFCCDARGVRNDKVVDVVLCYDVCHVLLLLSFWSFF